MYTSKNDANGVDSVSAVRLSHVQGSIEGLDRTVSELHGAIDVLTDRLSTVLRMEPTDASNPAPQAISNRVILSNKIESAAERVALAMARISDILNRLEV